MWYGTGNMSKSLFLALLLAASAFSQSSIPARQRIVILVRIDGFPAYALNDPLLPVPNIRRLAAHGALASSLEPVNPTVTWPNHTSMVTGVTPSIHKVLFNGLLVREPGEVPRIDPWVDKSKLVHAPTVYDAAHSAGLTTAEVDRVAIQNPGTITWSFAERPSTNGVIERELIASGLLTAWDIEQFSQAPITWRDHIWTEAAAHIIRKHKPNLLLFHLLTTDSVHHRYGPRSLAGASALALADARLGQLIAATEAAGFQGKSTFIIVSDHGFKAVRRTIQPNALLRDNGLIRDESGKLVTDAYAVSEGGTALVYVTRPERRAELVPRLKQMLALMEGVAGVVEPAGFAALGLPTPAASDQSPDLVLAAKDTYSFTGANKGAHIVALTETSGSHGYLNSEPDLQAIFIASGYGIRPGVHLDQVRNIDIAPTIAALFGLKLPEATGKPISALALAQN